MNRKQTAFIAGNLLACLLALSPVKAFAADSWSGIDKANHFAVSASIAKLTANAYGKKTGIVAALIPGALKELSDLYGTGTPSVRDMAANLTGAIFGAMLPDGYMVAPIDNKGAINGAMIAYYFDL